MSIKVNESMLKNSFSYLNNNINILNSRKTFPANKTDFTKSFKNLYDLVNNTNSNNTYDYYSNSNAIFIKNYNKLLSNFKELSSHINLNNKNGIWNKKTIASSNKNILSSNSLFNINKDSSFIVNIKSIAKKQTNTSNWLKKDDKSQLSSFNVTLEKNGKSSVFSIYNNEEDNNKTVMEKLLAVINTSNEGIKAEIEENENNEVRLLLSSDYTGRDQSFTISMDNNIDSVLNLNKNITSAQDANYTIVNYSSNEQKTYSSNSNNIDIDSYRISGTIHDIGTVTVESQIDKDKLFDNLENLTSAFNKTIDFLDEHYDKGSGVKNTLEDFTEMFYLNDQIKEVGLSFDHNGYLSIDREIFDDAFDNNLSSLKEIISGSDSFFSNIDKKINNALTTSSFSLIENELLSNHNNMLGDYESNDFMNQMNALGLYVQNGSVGVINYAAVGLLLNMYI